MRQGTVIPASPLALTAGRRLDERRQRALWRYYSASGAGGIAIGVHTTQFQIRDPAVGLFQPVLELGADEMNRLDAVRRRPLVRVAGICGATRQAVVEAETARHAGYHAGLLSLAALKDAGDDALIAHCRTVADILPVVGFYLQPAVGGRDLSAAFWRRFCGIENVVAVKVAPFNRYRTLDVIRGLAESGRGDIALYTGNDDNIVADLLTPFCFVSGGQQVVYRFVGGLLGHWSVWTKSAVGLLEACHRAVADPGKADFKALLRRNVQVTDMNAAVFDAANGFAGCIAGIHEVLRQQGLLRGVWCLNPAEKLGRGQKREIERVRKAYPDLLDDEFILAHRDKWLNG